MNQFNSHQHATAIFSACVVAAVILLVVFGHVVSSAVENGPKRYVQALDGSPAAKTQRVVDAAKRSR